ncbi:hypothetical protein [Listeria grandensis]|uniref:hypothetical protein n=1 Tax=Listeria grandensis TaxID=1494963 RepID=UPI00164DD245|nr:hypothetical protein [Listeria grandensis]MBC6316461.1 hypothetical protein [Listeria grandensis]
MVQTCEKLKQDLKKLEPIEFYMKYIIKSYNWYFEEVLEREEQELINITDDFKEIIMKNFNVGFHSVQMVGSAKIGFSLSPRKSFREFIRFDSNSEDYDDKHDKVSDLDLAIISPRLFEEIWAAIRTANKVQRLPTRKYNSITNAIFNGYINDSSLEYVTGGLHLVKDTINSANVELRDTFSIPNPISYRIYRSWEDLENYQLIGIESARRNLL